MTLSRTSRASTSISSASSSSAAGGLSEASTRALAQLQASQAAMLARYLLLREQKGIDARMTELDAHASRIDGRLNQETQRHADESRNSEKELALAWRGLEARRDDIDQIRQSLLNATGTIDDLESRIEDINASIRQLDVCLKAAQDDVEPFEKAFSEQSGKVQSAIAEKSLLADRGALCNQMVDTATNLLESMETLPGWIQQLPRELARESRFSAALEKDFRRALRKQGFEFRCTAAVMERMRRRICGNDHAFAIRDYRKSLQDIFSTAMRDVQAQRAKSNQFAVTALLNVAVVALLGMVYLGLRSGPSGIVTVPENDLFDAGWTEYVDNLRQWAMEHDQPHEVGTQIIRDLYLKPGAQFDAAPTLKQIRENVKMINEGIANPASHIRQEAIQRLRIDRGFFENVLGSLEEWTASQHPVLPSPPPIVKGTIACLGFALCAVTLVTLSRKNTDQAALANLERRLPNFIEQNGDAFEGLAFATRLHQLLSGNRNELAAVDTALARQGFHALETPGADLPDVIGQFNDRMADNIRRLSDAQASLEATASALEEEKTQAALQLAAARQLPDELSRQISTQAAQRAAFQRQLPSAIASLAGETERFSRHNRDLLRQETHVAQLQNDVDGRNHTHGERIAALHAETRNTFQQKAALAGRRTEIDMELSSHVVEPAQRDMAWSIREELVLPWITREALNRAFRRHVGVSDEQLVQRISTGTFINAYGHLENAPTTMASSYYSHYHLMAAIIEAAETMRGRIGPDTASGRDIVIDHDRPIGLIKLNENDQEEWQSFRSRFSYDTLNGKRQITHIHPCEEDRNPIR